LCDVNSAWRRVQIGFQHRGHMLEWTARGSQVMHTFEVTSGKAVSLVHCCCMGGAICVGPKDDNWLNGHW